MVTYECGSFDPVRPVLPTQPGIGMPHTGMGFPHPGMGMTQPGMSLPHPGMGFTHPGIGFPQPSMSSQRADVQYGGHAQLPLSPKATPFLPPGSEKVQTLQEINAALRGLNSSSGLYKPPSMTSNAANTVNPLHMFHTLKSPPTTYSLHTSSAPHPHSISATTSAFGMDVTSEISNLKHLYNCQSRQLAAETTSLRSMRDADQKADSELRAMVGTLSSLVTLQEEIRNLNVGLASVDQKFHGFVDQIEAMSLQAGQDPTAKSTARIESVGEMQKMHSTTISSLAGQVGTLDRLVQETTGALTKVTQTLSATTSDQGLNIKDLESQCEYLRRTTTANMQVWQLDRESTSKELYALKSRLSDVSFDAHPNSCDRAKNQEQDQEIKHLRSMLDRSAESYESLSKAMVKLRGDIVEVKAEADRSFFAHRANGTADMERWMQINSKVTKVQSDVTGLLKRVQHNAIDTDTALESLSDDVADLDKRMDEGVVVTDARVAAAVARVTEVEEGIIAVKTRVACARPEASGSGTTQHDVKLVEESLRNTMAKIDETSAAMESLKQETQTKLADLAASDSSKVGVHDFASVREVLTRDLEGVQDAIGEISLRVRDGVADAASKAALKGVHAELLDELAILHDATDSLTDACEYPNMAHQTVEDFVSSTVNNKFQEAQDDSTCKTQTLKAMIDSLALKLNATRVTQDDRITSAITQSDDQTTLTREFVGGMTDLNDRLDDALETRDAQIASLTSRLEELAAQPPNHGNPVNSGNPETTPSAFGQLTPSAFGQPTTSSFGQPTRSSFGRPTPSAFGQPAPSPFDQSTPSSFGLPRDRNADFDRASNEHTNSPWLSGAAASGFGGTRGAPSAHASESTGCPARGRAFYGGDVRRGYSGFSSAPGPAGEWSF